MPKSLLLAILMVAACGATEARGLVAPTLPPEAYMPEGSTWAGKWHTSLGPLDIIRLSRSSGYDFGGAYERVADGMLVTGVFTANAANNTVRLQWVEKRAGLLTSGKAIWRMNPDGTSFGGMWGKGNSATDGGHWEGRRDDPDRPSVAVLR